MGNVLIGFDFEKMQPIGFELVDVQEVETYMIEIDGNKIAVIVITGDEFQLMSEVIEDIDHALAMGAGIAQAVMVCRTASN